jgi:hypothetical protein
MDERGDEQTELLDTERPGRRVAAIAALATLPVLVLLVVFIVLDNLGLVVALVLSFGLFFAGTWGALSRREWWRWLSAAAGAIGAIGVLVVVAGIGWVSTGATLMIFVLCAAFVALTRYALGDRIEVEV